MSLSQATLRELHRIHRQLADLRERSERGPKQIKAREANVKKVEEDLAQAKANVKAAKVTYDQKQLILRSGESKIEDLRRKLGAANSNREYQALLEQIAADEMANSVMSDEILEVLEKIDGLQAIIPEREQTVAKAKEELAKAQQQVREQQSLIDGDITRLQGQLEEVEQSLPAEMRDKYMRIVNSRGSDAMASVDGETCGGCFSTLTANQVNSLRLGNVVFCQSCGRLMYLPEDPVRVK